jgi:hypothetical protein
MDDERVDHARVDHKQVDQMFRALPREMASPGFTARVLERFDDLKRVEAEARTRRAARIFGLPRLTLPAVVLAATLAVAASLSLQGGGMLASPPLAPRHAARTPLSSVGAVGRMGTPQRAMVRPVPLTILASTGRLQDLRAARQARALLQLIRSDHTRLHDEMRRSEAQSAKIYLGGDEDADLVVHLDQVRELPGRQDDPPPYRYD